MTYAARGFTVRLLAGWIPVWGAFLLLGIAALLSGWPSCTVLNCRAG